jgi:hypothetical protein
MSVAHVIGIDPGLVDTGVVSLWFRPAVRKIMVEHAVIGVPTAIEVKMWLAQWPVPYRNVFIEAYRPRQRLGTDTRMLELESDLRHVLPGARFLPNMGVKRIITQDLMEMLEVWRFSTTTHHQDLRSAARIALLGMVKDDDLNWHLAEMVREHLDGQLWTVDHA